jgi:hypothetical protein
MLKRFQVQAWRDLWDDAPFVEQQVTASNAVEAVRLVLFDDRLGWCDWVEVVSLDMPQQKVQFLDARASALALEYETAHGL